jgi:hypothetical protein
VLRDGFGNVTPARGKTHKAELNGGGAAGSSSARRAEIPGAFTHFYIASTRLLISGFAGGVAQQKTPHRPPPTITETATPSGPSWSYTTATASAG